MILIKNGKIFVEGVETNNPELIGLALMDVIEPNVSDENEVYEVSVNPLEESLFKTCMKQHLGNSMIYTERDRERNVIHSSKVEIKFIDPKEFGKNPAFINNVNNQKK
jgi:hypothetical protein